MVHSAIARGETACADGIVATIWENKDANIVMPSSILYVILIFLSIIYFHRLSIHQVSIYAFDTSMCVSLRVGGEWVNDEEKLGVFGVLEAKLARAASAT